MFSLSIFIFFIIFNIIIIYEICPTFINLSYVFTASIILLCFCYWKNIKGKIHKDYKFKVIILYFISVFWTSGLIMLNMGMPGNESCNFKESIVKYTGSKANLKYMENSTSKLIVYLDSTKAKAKKTEGNFNEDKSLNSFENDAYYLIRGKCEKLSFNRDGYKYLYKNPDITSIKSMEEINNETDVLSISRWFNLRIIDLEIFMDDLRANLSEKVIKLYGETEGALINSLVIGSRDNNLDDKTLVLKSLGLIHILSISGFHIALLDEILEKLKFRKFSILIIIIYCTLVGSIPAFRSALTKVLSTIFKKLRKPSDSLNNLLISALIMITIRPSLIFNLSFQLTYLSTLGLFIFTKPIMYYLHTKVRFKHISKEILMAFSISISTMLTTLPLTYKLSYYFNVTSFLSNIFILPIYTLITLSAFFCLCVSIIPLPQFIVLVIGKFFSYLLSLSNVIESIFLRFLTFVVPSEHIVFFYTFLLLCILWLYYLSKRCSDLYSTNKIKLKYILCILIAISFISSSFYPFPYLKYSIKNGSYELRYFHGFSCHVLRDDSYMDEFAKKGRVSALEVIKEVEADNNGIKVERDKNKILITYMDYGVNFTLGRGEVVFDESLNVASDDIIISEYILFNGKLLK